jgi:hypothetical protein
MDNVRQWEQAEFRERYVEVLVQVEFFTQAALTAIRESNAGNDFAAKESYDLADARHKKATRLFAELDLEFRKRLGGKKLLDWSKQEVSNNVRLRALLRWMSTTMSLLLDVHRISLMELQLGNSSGSGDEEDAP